MKTTKAKKQTKSPVVINDSLLISVETKLSAPYRLNVGCGRNIREGWLNLDFAALPGVDIVKK